MPTVKGTLAYVCAQKPVLNSYKGTKEFKATVILEDEDAADEWNESFKKQPAKVIKTSDFEEHFKFAPPYPKEKKHYYIELKQGENYPDGKPRTGKERPRVFLTTGKDKEGKPLVKDITETKLVANGSVGVVKYTISETDKWGTLAYLKDIRVDELIEYIPKVVEDEDDEDFGVVINEAEEDFEEPEVKSKTPSKKVQESQKESKVKPTRTKSQEPEDDLEDSPF